MEISSTGEYHDHRGRWSGTELGFEPLEFAISGERATEYLRVAFPANGKLTLNSVTETAGGKSVLECAGRRATTTARH
jgi:hypothetical protein